MADEAASNVIKHLRRAVLLHDGAGLTDGELLEAFVAQRDGTCFEALVRRHGPMVLGVCRRILRNPHDAADAFQATFLVLVRKAGSVVPREMVGNWLYGVAYRTALEARRATARRRARERQLEDLPHPVIEPEESWRELRLLLDRELERLPGKYRTAVVLCDLEGRTRKEAARQLNLPEGTISGRLTTARRILAERLSRRGLALSSATLAVVLSQGYAAAAVPLPLVTCTVQVAATAGAAGMVSAHAAAIASGVARGLAWAKVKTALTLLGLGVLVGTGLTAYQLQRSAGQTEAAHQSPLPAPLPACPPLAQEKLQGTWVAVSSELDGVKDFDKGLSNHQLVFAGDRVTYWSRKGPQKGIFRLDATTKPNAIDIEFAPGSVLRGIYDLDGTRLRFCWTKGGGRPRNFDTTTGEMLTFLYTYQKEP
jgi:RNA polymerase sigma factor (sigma-70 family)